MMRHTYCLAALLVLAAPVAAQEARPVWKEFDRLNRPLWQIQTTETLQTMKVQGQDVSQKQVQTFTVKLTPRRKGGNSWEVDYEIVAIKLAIDIGGSSIAYDSESATNAGGPFVDYFKTLLNQKLTLKLTNHPIDGLKVTAVEGLEALVKKVGEDNPQLKAQFEQMMTKETFETQLAWPVGAFPQNDDEWKHGSWTRSSVMNLGPIGKYDTTYTYTRDKGDATKVGVKAEVKYSAPRRGGDAGLPFKIVKADMRSNHSGGNITLDLENGRVAECTLKYGLKGTLTIDIGGQETQVELVQTQTSTIRMTETDPLRKRK